MAIVVKAASSFSATAAVATTWSVTQSTSIAAGDTLILAVSFRGSLSISLSAVTDNAGNVWTRFGFRATQANMVTEAWFAPVTTVTANFQIAMAVGQDKTISVRAATVMVLSGAHATTPIDLGSVKVGGLLNTTNATATVSTSLTTTADASLLVAIAAINNEVSASLAADALWTATTAPIKATGGSPISGYTWHRSIVLPAIYNWSASLSSGGAAKTWNAIIFAMRDAALPTGSLTGTADIVFGSTALLTADAALAGTAAVAFGSTALLTAQASLTAVAAITFGSTAALGGTASLSGTAAVVFASTAALTATADLTGTAALAFDSTADLAATADLAGSADLAFDLTGTLDGIAASVTASVAQAAATYGVGSWDPFVFRQLLLEKKRKLQKAVAAVANEAEDTPLEPRAGRLEQRIEVIVIPDTRAAMQRAMQSLGAMERQLAQLEAKLQDDEDDDEFLIMVA